MSFRPAALLLVVSAAGLPAQASRTALAPGSFVVTNVNLIPMTRETVIRNAAVVVKDGKIIAAGPAASVSTPNGARRIDGRGGYLMPGLADMHTHLYSDDHVPDSLGRYEMGIFLANGITTARLMIGTTAQQALRKEIEAGRVIGPQLWLASPQLAGRADVNTKVVTTPQGAKVAVDDVADAGYDFVKITNFIDLATYDGIMAEAKVRGIRVDGHVNPGVGVLHAAVSGQHLQHLDGWFEAALADTAPMKVSLTQYGVFSLNTWKSIDFIDDSKIAPLAGAVARSGIWSTPTLALFNTVFAAGETDAEIRARPDWALIPSDFRNAIMGARSHYWTEAAAQVRTEARRKRYVEFRYKVVKALSDSGAHILAGSDAPDWFMSAGYTLHRELAALVAAGLTPFQALAAATKGPARFLGASNSWGTIEVGQRADLVLLERNPLEDIRNTTSIQATVIGGRWLARADLDAMVATAARRMNPVQ